MEKTRSQPPSKERRPIQSVTVDHAEMEDLERLLPLFDAYRIFYGKDSEPGPCRTFLFSRLMDEDSLILLAFEGEADQVEKDRDACQALGFVQLFPTFSSVALNDVWILNDLYVIPEARGNGVGRQLIEAARDMLKQRWDHGLVLETARDNAPAKALYESLGFERDEAFDHYQLRF